MGGKNQEIDFARVDLQRLWSLELGEKRRTSPQNAENPSEFHARRAVGHVLLAGTPQPAFFAPQQIQKMPTEQVISKNNSDILREGTSLVVS